MYPVCLAHIYEVAVLLRLLVLLLDQLLTHFGLHLENAVVISSATFISKSP